MLIALCHNRDLQKTNGGIIVVAGGSVPPDADSHLSEYATALAVTTPPLPFPGPELRLHLSLSSAVTLGSTGASAETQGGSTRLTFPLSLPPL